jgi:hypothetical protein
MRVTAEDGLDALRGLAKGLRPEARHGATAELERGRVLAGALAGAWRTLPPPWTLPTTALREIAPLLIRSGTAGLAWRCLSNSDLPGCNAALQLRQAHRHDVLQAALREHQLIQTLKLLHGARIEPLLAKGWAVARLYPECGLRPYGDIDLYVRPEQYPLALATLAPHGARTGAIDLHKGVATLNDRPLDEPYDRSQTVGLADVAVRVLAPEDQLRHLCLHLLRHGASSPLWLCDIGAALESLPAGFDWEYFLGGDRRRTDWAVCGLALAHHVLGARLDRTPIARRAEYLPGWLVPAVFRRWQLGRGHIGTLPAAALLLRPADFLKALRLRWPDPIQATVSLGGPFNELPRLPFQLGECIKRTSQFVARGEYLSTKMQ